MQLHEFDFGELDLFPENSYTLIRWCLEGLYDPEISIVPSNFGNLCQVPRIQSTIHMIRLKAKPSTVLELIKVLWIAWQLFARRYGWPNIFFSLLLICCIVLRLLYQTFYRVIGWHETLIDYNFHSLRRFVVKQHTEDAFQLYFQVCISHFAVIKPPHPGTHRARIKIMTANYTESRELRSAVYRLLRMEKFQFENIPKSTVDRQRIPNPHQIIANGKKGSARKLRNGGACHTAWI